MKANATVRFGAAVVVAGTVSLISLPAYGQFGSEASGNLGGSSASPGAGGNASGNVPGVGDVTGGAQGSAPGGEGVEGAPTDALTETGRESSPADAVTGSLQGEAGSAGEADSESGNRIEQQEGPAAFHTEIEPGDDGGSASAGAALESDEGSAGAGGQGSARVDEAE